MVMRYRAPPDRTNGEKTPAGAGQGLGAPERPVGTDAPLTALETIDVRLRRDDGGWTTDIRYHRPDISTLTCGYDTAEAGERLGRVHSYCGYAHEIAFARAAESASGSGVESDARRSARDLQLFVEQALAHGRRAALELAPVQGAESPVAELRDLLRAAEAAQGAIGMPSPGGAIAPSAEQLPAAFSELAAHLEALLRASSADPPVESLELLPEDLRDGVEAGWRRPWQFLESDWPNTAALLHQLAPEAPQTLPHDGEGTGSGTAATSRGQLTYQVTLRGGRVESCRSSTPTERLTTDGGALSQQLSQLPDDGEVLDLAQLIVLALDPCAATRISFGERTHV